MSPEQALQAGLDHHASGRLDQAAECYRAVLAFEPAHPHALHLLGVIAHQQGDSTQAIELISRAIALSPAFAAFHTNLGNAFRALGRRDDAVVAFRTAIALDPRDPDPLLNCGIVLREQNRLTDARAAYDAALRLRPDWPPALSNLGNVLKDQGLVEPAIDAYRRALALDPGHHRAHSNLIFALQFSSASAGELLDEHRRWALAHAPPAPPLSHTRPPRRPIRVGLISPDFRDHPVGRFVLPLLECRDRAEFHLTCYADAQSTDAVTDSLRRASDDWRLTSGLVDGDLARRIAEDRLDLLIDLSGHTANNRLRVFAHRPAPVSVTWLGYPGTTGLDAIDFRITDSVADPAGAESHHTERLVRLDPIFLCFRLHPDTPPVAPLPAIRKGYVTFGCFNALAKLSPGTLGAFASVLDAVPGSRLALKSLALVDPGTVELLRARLPNTRIDILPPRQRHLDHLHAYDQVDIALDTLIYNGTTTTCEALAMGVPVVTLRGDRHASRVGASILTAVGLPSLVAGDVGDYVRIAADLAGDLPALERLRAGMRERVTRSPLCNEQAFARRMEQAWRTMVSAASSTTP